MNKLVSSLLGPHVRNVAPSGGWVVAFAPLLHVQDDPLLAKKCTRHRRAWGDMLYGCSLPPYYHPNET